MYIPLTFEGALQSCLYASGGYEQGFFLSGSDQYAFHLFSQTGSHQLQVLAGTLNNVQIGVIGGGGGGAVSLLNGAGGGGGGVIVSQNNILYAGTYSINVGRGGSGGAYHPSINNPGETGNPSSISGQNLYLSVDGGKGGNGNVGGDSGLPTAFSGSAGSSTRGGGGAGAGGAAPVFGFPYFGANGPGIIAYFGGQVPAIGATGKLTLAAGGFGYNWDAPNPTGSEQGQFGTGGDGSNRNSGNDAQDGRNGAVIVQYKINDYCKNWFNETGSCGCSQATFGIPLNESAQYFDLTGSYFYTQCGSSEISSGSLISNFPVTVCVASGSWGRIIRSNQIGAQVITDGFASGNNCFSASYGIQTCVTQSFQSTCTSSFVTFVAGTGSTGPQSLYYVPRLNSSITYGETLANNYLTYRCVSSGSSFGFYPTGISGGGSKIYLTAACNNVTFTNNDGGGKTYKYWNCNGQYAQVALGGYSSASACIDTTLPYGFYGNTVNTNVTVGTDCLGSALYTGSCGCNPVSQTYSIIQNCSSLVTATALFSGSYYPSTGFTFISNTSGLSGSCWNVIGTGSFEAFPTYSNVVTQSSYTNCTNCEITVFGTGSVSWSFSENSQDGLFTIYDNANTITTLSGSGTGNNSIVTGHYITASLTPVNMPTSGAVVMNIYANGTSVTQSIATSANTTITSSFLVASGSRTSVTASITYYPSGITGARQYVFLAGNFGGTATYRLAGATTDTSTTLSPGSSIQVCAYTNSVNMSGGGSKQFVGPVCGNIITSSCDCYSASFTAGDLWPYAIQYIPCSSSVFNYVILNSGTFSGCISYPSSSLATAGQEGSPTSSLSLSGSCKSGNCP